MKAATKTALVLTLAVMVSPAAAQRPGLFGGLGERNRSPSQSQSPGGSRLFAPRATDPAPAPAEASDAPSEPTDGDVLRSGAVLPEPTAPDAIAPARIPLPTEPLEPYLLTKEAGPFMVLARTFVGPEASRYAQALAIELRRDFGLPAYVYLYKVKPLNSNIQGIPPTADRDVNTAQVGPPESYRIFDEAGVLVGNEKTLDAANKLLKRVKWIQPKILDDVPSIFHWRRGLKNARVTTNPLIDAQYLFPRVKPKDDPLIQRMNAGPRSLFHCPGAYTLPVAEFSGRSTLLTNDPDFLTDRTLKQSPLATAADDAEKLAETLSRDETLRRAGYQPYVYHDRYSSRVTVGSFVAPDDPKVTELRQVLDEVSRTSVNEKGVLLPLAPARQLMEVPH